MKVYPNPATEYLNIQWNGIVEDLNVELINITGKIVFNQQVKNDSRLSVQNFPSGLYFIRISNDKTVQTKKV